MRDERRRSAWQAWAAAAVLVAGTLVVSCTGGGDEKQQSAERAPAERPAKQGGARALARPIMPKPGELKAAGLRLSSPDVAMGSTVPTEFTCDGDNVSPALNWTAPAAGVTEFALVVDDPDAPGGTFTHWILYSLPATAGGVPRGFDPGAEGATPQAEVARNDFGKDGYGGPCPPPGPAHRYVFHLIGLSDAIELPQGAGRAEFDEAIEGKVVEQAEMTATYARQE